MKKLFIIMLCMLVFLKSADAKDLSIEYSKYISSMGQRLEQLDIVRNANEKYNSDSYISRREAFQMAYIVKCGKRMLVYEPNDTDSVAELCKQKQEYLINIHFSDVNPGTYDYALVYSLVYENLLLGETDIVQEENMTYSEYVEKYMSAEVRANLNDNLTYEEALNIIGRLLYIPENWHTLGEELAKIIDTTAIHPYYDAAINNGLINSDLGAPQITEDMLNQSISAYEFMHLLYRALYIPTVRVSDFGTNFEIRYIDNYINNVSFDDQLEDYNDATKITD